MLNPPESVRSRFGAKALRFGGTQEIGLDITRHESSLFRFQIRPLKGGEIHVRSRQGDTGRVLVTAQAVPGRFAQLRRDNRRGVSAHTPLHGACPGD